MPKAGDGRSICMENLGIEAIVRRVARSIHRSGSVKGAAQGVSIDRRELNLASFHVQGSARVMERERPKREGTYADYSNKRRPLGLVSVEPREDLLQELTVLASAHQGGLQRCGIQLRRRKRERARACPV